MSIPYPYARLTEFSKLEKGWWFPDTEPVAPEALEVASIIKYAFDFVDGWEFYTSGYGVSIESDRFTLAGRTFQVEIEINGNTFTEIDVFEYVKESEDHPYGIRCLTINTDMTFER